MNFEFSSLIDLKPQKILFHNKVKLKSRFKKWFSVYLQCNCAIFLFFLTRYSDKGWDLDEAKVFLVIDVFIKRLRDLLKVILFIYFCLFTDTD